MLFPAVINSNCIGYDLLRSLVPVLPQSGETEKEEAHEFRLTPHAGLAVNALEIGAGGVHGDADRRGRLLDRFALRQPGGQPGLTCGQRIQLAQMLLVAAVEPNVRIPDKNRGGRPPIAEGLCPGPQGNDQHAQRVRPGGAGDRQRAAGIRSAPSGSIERAAQQAIQLSALGGYGRPYRVAACHQTVAGQQNLLSVPIRTKAIAVLVDEYDAPGQVVEGVEGSVSLDLEVDHPPVHSKRSLQMRQQRSATFDVTAVERGAAARPHDIEKQDSRLLPRKHRAKPVMQVLWL